MLRLAAVAATATATAAAAASSACQLALMMHSEIDFAQPVSIPIRSTIVTAKDLQNISAYQVEVSSVNKTKTGEAHTKVHINNK